MSKTIHIHIHRAPAKDAWEESKHKRASNGQFGSGGGGAASAPPHQLTVGAKHSNGKPAYGTLEVGGKKYQFSGKEDGRVEMGLQAFSSMEKAVAMLSAPGATAKKPATPAPAKPTASELPPHRLVVSGKHPNGKPAYGTLEVGGKRYHYSGREDGGVDFGVQGFSSMEKAVAALGSGGAAAKPAAKSAPAAKSSEALASEAYSAYVEASNQGDRAKADHFLRQHDKYAKAAKAEKAPAKPAAKSASSAPAKDNWEESKHKRATNGQFGSGGGATAKPAAKSAPAAKPAAKSAPAAKPAIAVKYATSGSSALARLQAQSNAHLKKTGFGHLVTPPKNAPGTGTPKKSFEQQVKETHAAQLAAAARKSLGIKEPGARPAAPAGPKSFEQHVKETRMKQLAAAGAKSLGVKPAAPKAAAPKASGPSTSPEMAAQVTSELNAALKAAGSDYDAKTKAVQTATKTLAKAGFSPDDASSAPTKTQKLPEGLPESIAAAVRNSNGVRSVQKTEAGVQIQIDHHNGYGSATYTLAPDGSLMSGSSGAQSGAGTRKVAGPGEGEAALVKAISTQAKKTPPSFIHEPNGMRLHPGRREKFSWS